MPILGLSHLEVTDIQVTLASKPALILEVYLPPSHALIGADLTTCFDGGLPVLIAGDLNANHVDWNSRLNTRRKNSYVIVLTRTQVGCLDRTPQPPTHTTPRLLPMSWTSR